MHVAWGSFVAVFLVSFASAVGVVVLVAFALVGLSSRAAWTASADRSAQPARRVPKTASVGTAIAGICLAAAAAVVLYGLWLIVSA
jgi:hypothetical protein